MDNRAEVREFLVSRRAKVTPEQIGLAPDARRRVPGLRRGEVAALARALLLDEAERAHLFDLAYAASPSGRKPRRRSPKTWTPHASLQWSLDAVTAGPAFVRNGRMDLLATNALARAFYLELYDMPGQPNFARFTFLDPDAAHDFYPDWDGAADICVAILRTEAGRDPHDKDLHDLIGELSTRSPDFRRLWSSHNVRQHGAGTKRFHHSDVGDLELAYESVDMISDPGLTLTLYAAEPGSPTAHALDLLASWAAVSDDTSAHAHHMP